MRIGVYICRVSAETAGGANLESVGHYVANLPQVEVVRSLGLLPRLDPEALADEIAAAELDRIVIAGDSPGFFKPAFTRAMSLAGTRARRSEARVVPRARGERRRRDRAGQGHRRLRRLRRPVHARRAAEGHEVDVRHARDRRRHRRHPGGARDRRRRQEGLPRRAHRHHRRPHGDVRQDLPDPRLRRLHPDAQDGGRRAAPDDRPAQLLRGRVHQRRPRLVPRHRAAPRAARRRGRLRGLQHLQRRVPGQGARASSTPGSPSARRSTSRSPRRCPTPTSSTRRRAPTCRPTGRSAASAPRSAPRSASTSTLAATCCSSTSAA